MPSHNSLQLYSQRAKLGPEKIRIPSLFFPHYRHQCHHHQDPRNHHQEHQNHQNPDQRDLCGEWSETEPGWQHFVWGRSWRPGLVFVLSNFKFSSEALSFGPKKFPLHMWGVQIKGRERFLRKITYFLVHVMTNI